MKKVKTKSALLESNVAKEIDNHLEQDKGKMQDEAQVHDGQNKPNLMGGHKRGMMGEKPKDFKKSWGKILSSCKQYSFVVVLAIIFTIVATVITLIGPKEIEKITNLIMNGIMTGIDITAVTNIAILLVCLYGAGAVLSYLEGYIMATVTQKLTKKLRKDIATKINKVPLKYLDGTTTGNVLSRVTNDADTIGQSLNNSIIPLISGIVLFIGSIIMMFITNWIMALSAIGATVLGFLIMGIILSKSQKYFTQQQQSLGEINGHIEEVYSSHNVVIAYNGQKQTRQKFDEINNKLFESAWKSQFLSGLMMPLMNFIGNLGYVVVCVVGGALALNGTIEFGVITAFIIYARLFSQPLTQLAQVATNLQSTAAASERVFEILEENELADESHKTKTLSTIKGDVEFKNVQFGYNENKLIIKNFNAKIKAGQKVAIVGPTGAGKTTLVNLLMRFYELNSGDILIDGVSIQDLTRENVHQLFGMVLQDSWLFEGSIKDNIRYSKSNVTDEQIYSACEKVGVAHFIRSLPNQYNTILDDTATISSGQKQLLTIARAMVENAPLLILDEATSNVDTRTEILIQNAMEKLTKNRTSFVIAHRLSTIKNADIILVMKEGDIVEQGTHKTLLDQNGYYATLYNSQFTENPDLEENNSSQ